MSTHVPPQVREDGVTVYRTDPDRPPVAVTEPHVVTGRDKAIFGAVALVFEHGVLNDALGIGVVGPVISFMPIILMGVLFGLAMDYEVFLVTRMREDYVRTGDAVTSVRTGFSASARVVVAAALIMIFVFAFFVPEGSFYVQPIALGLAVGVAVDAFIVRMTLVPAVMTLLGARAWHLPAFLAAPIRFRPSSRERF